jgi:hypothetical protein
VLNGYSVFAMPFSPSRLPAAGRGPFITAAKEDGKVCAIMESM